MASTKENPNEYLITFDLSEASSTVRKAFDDALATRGFLGVAHDDDGHLVMLPNNIRIGKFYGKKLAIAAVDAARREAVEIATEEKTALIISRLLLSSCKPVVLHGPKVSPT